MYTTCLFCHSPLGANESIESFPVGRRIAFDAARGRLWVVCRKCERWNLTPLEERWEAIEQCERLFSATRLKVSTDNIGLSRVREGLELVRIGSPQRPEMAAWRYGDQFGRRRRRYIGVSVAGALVVGGVIAAGPMLGVSVAGGGWGLFQGANALIRAARDRIVRTRVAIPGFDQPSIIRGRDIKHIVLGMDEEGMTLRLPYNQQRIQREVTLRGEEAMRAVGKVLPAVNIKGGDKKQVETAVRFLDEAPDPMRLFATSLTHGRVAQQAAYVKKRSRRIVLPTHETFIDRIPAPMLLAMEMAAHEDVERRAMEGELAILEAAWQQAEEIAKIADDLLIPETVDAEMRRLASEPLPRRPGD